MKNVVLFLVLLVLAHSFKYRQTKKFRFSKKGRAAAHKAEEELPKLSERIEEMEEQIGKVDYINLESFRVLMKNRGMIPGEIQFVFDTVDRNKKNKLNQIEWQSFFKVFIEPFEKCDTSKTYLMSADDLGKCLEEGELAGLKLTADNTTALLELLNKDEEHLVTFADYLYLRRVNLGWGDCAGGTIMSQIQIPCGMKVVVPGMIATAQDVKMIMDIVIAFSTGKAANSDPYMHLMEFIQTSYIYYYFYAFQIPYQHGQVNKQDMKRAVDYQIVQIGLNAKIIDQIFGEQDELDLKSFAVSLIVYQTFRRFSKIDKFGMAEDEWLLCLKQITFSKTFLAHIDNIFIPTQEEYDEASKRPEVVFHERDFLVTFLQTGYTSQKHRVHSHSASHGRFSAEHRHEITKQNNLRFKTKQNDENYDEDKQKLIYNQFEFKNKQKLNFPQFIRFYKFTWLFMNYDTDLNNILTYQEIRNGIESYDPPIPLTLEETQWMQWSQDFVSNPVLDEYDLKQWYSMAMFDNVFSFYKQSAFTSFITEAKLKMSLYVLGYKTTQTTLDLSKQGKDPVNGNPLYNYWTAFKSAVKEEIICQKNHNYEEVEKIIAETIK